jgi:hypothetical protein
MLIAATDHSCLSNVFRHLPYNNMNMMEVYLVQSIIISAALRFIYEALLCIWEVLGSNLSLETGYLDIFMVLLSPFICQDKIRP